MEGIGQHFLKTPANPGSNPGRLVPKVYDEHFASAMLLHGRKRVSRGLGALCSFTKNCNNMTKKDKETMAASNQTSLICVGKVKEKYLKEGIADFTRRLSHYTKLQVIEVKDSGMEEEAERIIAHLRHDNYIIALCVKGRQHSSMELASLLSRMSRTLKNLTFIIGGADGLSPRIEGKAHLQLSLSPMTFTHEMCRLFLLEQLYRAHTIIKGKPYHK